MSTSIFQCIFIKDSFLDYVFVCVKCNKNKTKFIILNWNIYAHTNASLILAHRITFHLYNVPGLYRQTDFIFSSTPPPSLVTLICAVVAIIVHHTTRQWIIPYNGNEMVAQKSKNSVSTGIVFLVLIYFSLWYVEICKKLFLTHTPSCRTNRASNVAYLCVIVFKTLLRLLNVARIYLIESSWKRYVT